MGSLTVSVVIPAYNSEAYLADAIGSVLEQEVDNLECIVVDDGSTDSTGEIAKGFDRVRYVRQGNSGVSAARNRGAAEAHGELVAFLDADDAWLPTKLARQLDALREAGPEVGLVYCGLYETDEELNVLSERTAPEPEAALRNTLLMEPPVVSISQTGLVPRKVLDDVGGFDTRLSTSADTDMVLRIGRRYRLVGVAEPLVLYRTHGSQMSSNPDAMEHDMERILDELFSDRALPGDLRRLERRARANLDLAVGGARWAAGERSRGARDLGAAFLSDPSRTLSIVGGGLRRRLFGRRGPS